MAAVSVAASPAESRRGFTRVPLPTAIWLLVSVEGGQSQPAAPWKGSTSAGRTLSREGGSTKGPGSTRQHSVPAGNDKSMLETRTDSVEMPAPKALLFRGGASNGVLAYEIHELSKMLSKIAVAIGMLPDLKFDAVSRLFIFFLFFSFFPTK